MAGHQNKFVKYETQGAYHWHETDRRDFRRHNPVTAARYDLVAREIPPGNLKVLDAGCGDGKLTFRLGKRGSFAVGIDYSALGVQLARQRVLGEDEESETDVHFLQASVFALPFSSDSLDCIVFADVIEHINSPEAALCELRRVLKPGGRCIISTPQRMEGHIWDECHLAEYAHDEFFELLSDCFSRVVIKGSQPHFFFKLYFGLGARHRYIRWAMNLFSMYVYNPLRLQSANVRPYHGQLVAICHKG